ncbi:MAG: zf-HC2 domain-containing protein [Marmoricola sp.]
MLSLSGHIGSKVSALVDGQLPPAEEERAWSHVLTCPGCRRLVEREGWTKRQLGTLCGSMPVEPPPQLLGSLYDVDAWSAVDAIEKRSRRRRTTVALVGGGAVGACVLGLVTVAGGPTTRGDVPTRPSPANIRNDLTNAPVGSPTGTETNTSPIRVRRSR